MKVDRSTLSPEQLADLEKADRARLDMASFAEDRRHATKDAVPPPGKDRGPRERRQHVDSEIVSIEIKKGDKTSVARNKYPRPIDKLNFLTDRQKRAAEIFENDFVLSKMGGRPKISSMERLDGGGYDLTVDQLAAQERTNARLYALPEKARSAVYYIVGMQEKFADWVYRARSNKWPMDPKKAKGILDTALDILADRERIPMWYEE